MSGSLLHRYWLTFEPPLEMRVLGFGVTAYSLDDAVGLLARELGVQDVPKPTTIAEDFAFDELDQGHVVPNMHPITERGVWYPKLSSYH